ncbi:hypothetical protein [Rahnella sp. Larv3_ips]|uniref:hypothetical protein n=1 Tax=Rahnella sp. Larv3_ips TaxID=1896943 RepID=UPI000EFB41DD|nr:hypothetical protein [Rahnella sp. Larv3_ips]
MPCLSSLLLRSALVGSVFMLTGCPPPPDLTQWQRPHSTIDDARVAMGQCGVPLPGPEPDFTDNESVLYYQCMEAKGFTYKHGFHICDVYQDTPACRAKQLGRPLTNQEIESLPFVADSGLHPIKPDSGTREYELISWRKAGASLHFSHSSENDAIALPVMYQCGYPKPLGSRLAMPNIGHTKQLQACMLKNGFEPKKKLMLVCRNYPQLDGCSK